jgi:formate dehydrogenase subunit gamma
MPRHDRTTGEILRFALAPRWVHRATASLLFICLATGLTLYVGQLSLAVGHRALVEAVHVYCGIALPAPFLLGLLSATFRQDLQRLSRFLPVDTAWLRSRDRRSGRLPIGKFNAGQKLNGSFTLGAILVMLGTGLVMRYANGWPIRFRTGATFVHDWLTWLIIVIVAGHLWFAQRDPIARRGMRTGRVPVSWARREHPAWAAELDPPQERPTEDRPLTQTGAD